MKRKQKSSGPTWLEIIEYAEAQLHRAKLRTDQLEALIRVFRGHAEAGDPCPSELVTALKGGASS